MMEDIDWSMDDEIPYIPKSMNYSLPSRNIPLQKNPHYFDPKKPRLSPIRKKRRPETKPELKFKVKLDGPIPSSTFSSHFVPLSNPLKSIRPHTAIEESGFDNNALDYRKIFKELKALKVSRDNTYKRKVRPTTLPYRAKQNNISLDKKLDKLTSKVLYIQFFLHNLFISQITIKTYFLIENLPHSCCNFYITI